MASDYHHGVRVLEINNGTRSIRTVETSIIGVVCTADDADATVFPLNKPTQLIGVSRYLDKAGKTGTLARTLDAIKDQIEPIVYVIRVEDSDDEAELTGNTIKGLQKLLACKLHFGAKPKIIGAPELDTNLNVAVEIVAIADKLRAFAYVGCRHDSLSDVVQYRKNFGSKRVMIIYPEFIGFDEATASERTLSASARALGLRAKIDNDIGWHKTLSNVAVNGVSGISEDIFFDLETSATDSNYLNSNDVTTLIREDGFKFWGSRTCSNDKLFAFENYVRTGDILAETMANAHMWANDKPMSLALFKDILEGINSKLNHLTANGYLLGGEAWFDAELNPKELIKAGRAGIDYDYTPVPPLEDLTFRQRITDKYIVGLIDSAAAL